MATLMLLLVLVFVATLLLCLSSDATPLQKDATAHERAIEERGQRARRALDAASERYLEDIGRVLDNRRM